MLDQLTRQELIRTAVGVVPAFPALRPGRCQLDLHRSGESVNGSVVGVRLQPSWLIGQHLQRLPYLPQQRVHVVVDEHCTARQACLFDVRLQVHQASVDGGQQSVEAGDLLSAPDVRFAQVAVGGLELLDLGEVFSGSPSVNP
ncbi:hypothetical protein D9M70_536610 [compost metagenome]